ncbi:hypothetical protein KSP40_PGU021657 [Platanthera guangdongensis]|uniref:RING-type domain-containing protein n=1 Tax=Platanthera guangdongensis TaxID=2320717 RepID=A0ABR2LHA0_9ASPA
MESIMRREDAELMREGMSTTVEYLVRSAAGVPGMERPLVEVTVVIDEVCAVCLEEMVAGVEVVWTPCEHLFHGECLRRWFERAGSCPLCRFDFDHYSLDSRPDFMV